MRKSSETGTLQKTKVLSDFGNTGNMDAFNDDDPSDVYFGDDDTEEIFL